MQGCRKISKIVSVPYFTFLVFFFKIKMPFQAKKNGGTSGEKSGGFLSTVRSISDMGRSLSHGRNLGKIEEETKGGSAVNLELPKVEIMIFKGKILL